MMAADWYQLEEEHHSLAVFWSEGTAHIGGDVEANLSQLVVAPSYD